MTRTKGPQQVAAPFELLLASRPVRDTRFSAIAMGAAVAVHAVAFAALIVVASPASELAPVNGADVIMLELPPVSLEIQRPVAVAGIARTAGDPGSRWVHAAAMRTAVLEAPDLTSLDWVPPAPELQTQVSDAIFTSEHFADMGEAGGGIDGSPRELTLEELAAAPTYTPFTRGAELENREEVRVYLLGRYPRDLQDARIGGRTMLWILVDEKGHARKAVLLSSSGYASLDDAALESTDLMKFAPAWNSGHIIPVWVQLPVNFRVD